MISNIKTGRRPSIVITGGCSTDFPRGRELYAETVAKAGGKAVFVSPQDNVGDLVFRNDGFLIPGGRDLAPRLYEEETDYPIVLEEPERIDFELSLLREIIEKDKPAFGICYGMQLINVFFHGSLYQDLPSQVPESLEHSMGEHFIIIEKTPLIEAGRSRVNTSHHQAVKKVGKGLKAFAHARDGIIEAIYGEGHRFLVGVQWHPERMASPLSARLFERFLGACVAEG